MENCSAAALAEQTQPRLPRGIRVGIVCNRLVWLAHFLVGNLVPVTLGNIVWGGLMIDLYHRLIFRFPKKHDPVQM